MNNKEKNNFLIQGVILALASIIVRVIGIIYRIPLQNILGDEGMGYYSTAFTIYSILLIVSSYSMPGAISKLVSYRVARKEYKNAYKVLISGLSLAAFGGTIAAICTYFFAGQMASAFKFPQSEMALRALAPTLFLVAFIGIFRGFFQAFGTMIPTAISQIIEKIVQVIVSLILCYNIMDTMKAKSLTDDTIIPEAHGAYGATLGNAFGSLFALGFLVFVFLVFRKPLMEKIERTSYKTEESYATIYKAVILTTIPILLSSTINNISSMCDNFIVGNILDFQGYSKETASSLWGILSNKYSTFVSLPIAVATAMAISTMPSMSAAMAVNDMPTALSKIGLSVRFIYVFSAPCAVGVAVLANPLLQFLYYDGETGNKIGTYLLWLGAVTIILSSLVSITNSVLQGMGHLNLPVKHCAIGLGVHIIVAVVLMLAFDLNVYAIVIAEIALAVTALVLNYRYIIKHYDYHQEVKRTFIIPSIASVIMGVVTFIVYKITFAVTNARALHLIFPVIIAVIVYVILMVRLKGITREDLLEMPKGTLLLNIFTKLHIM